MKKNLILGIGNTLLTDDGIGPWIVEHLSADLSFLPPEMKDFIEFKSLPAFGFDTLFEIEGYSRVIIIDSLIDDTLAIGSIKILELSQILSMTYDGILVNHGLNLGSMWRFGEKMGLAMPGHCTLVGIRAREVHRFSADLSPRMKKLLSSILTEVKGKILTYLG
jgi:hydrogenase maturation protease